MNAPAVVSKCRACAFMVRQIVSFFSFELDAVPNGLHDLLAQVFMLLHLHNHVVNRRVFAATSCGTLRAERKEIIGDIVAMHIDIPSRLIGKTPFDEPFKDSITILTLLNNVSPELPE